MRKKLPRKSREPPFVCIPGYSGEVSGAFIQRTLEIRELFAATAVNRLYLPTTNTWTVVLANSEPSASLTSRISMRTGPAAWMPGRMIDFANVP